MPAVPIAAVDPQPLELCIVQCARIHHHPVKSSEQHLFMAPRLPLLHRQIHAPNATPPALPSMNASSGVRSHPSRSPVLLASPAPNAVGTDELAALQPSTPHRPIVRHPIALLPSTDHASNCTNLPAP